jgi:hypothetical protein
MCPDESAFIGYSIKPKDRQETGKGKEGGKPSFSIIMPFNWNGLGYCSF